jgi:hypothetical protein
VPSISEQSQKKRSQAPQSQARGVPFWTRDDASRREEAADSAADFAAGLVFVLVWRAGFLIAFIGLFNHCSKQLFRDVGHKLTSFLKAAATLDCDPPRSTSWQLSGYEERTS